MKKILRLLATLLAPVSVIAIGNIVLAETPVSTTPRADHVINARFKPGLNPAPVGQDDPNQGPITGLAISGLSITHTRPALIKEPITFTATIVNGTEPISYSWSFGDGTVTDPNAGSVVSHTYDMTGTYNVMVTAQNIVGVVEANILVTVGVEVPSGLAIIHTSPTLLNIPVHFTATIAGGTEPVSYAWSFGDGTELPFDAGATITHTYAMTGAYTVVVTAANVAGAVNETTSLTVEAEKITGLSITHTTRPLNLIPVVFTATIATGSPPVSYGWSFGDGSAPLFNAGPIVSHIYNEPGIYSVLVAAFNRVGSPVTRSIEVTIGPNPSPPLQRVYLPTILKKATEPKPDLTCELSIKPANPTAGQPVTITVQLENKGFASADGFWVDLYVNPTTLPEPGHLLRWQDACGGISSCPLGIAWGIETPLSANADRSLVSKSNVEIVNGYNPAETVWHDSLVAGTYDLYVYVDSIDNPLLPDTDGAVKESVETNNRCELLDLVVASSAVEIGQPEPLLEVEQTDEGKTPSPSQPTGVGQSKPSKLPPR